jgi:hypothetical protein
MGSRSCDNSTNYGLYCVRQFGPDGKASDIDRSNVTVCVDPALVPRIEAQSRTNEPRSGPSHSLVADLPIWATGQIVCFVLECKGAGKTTKTHGMLATDVRKDSKFGTCLMTNNNYETFSSQDISDAAERGAMPVYAHGCLTSTLQLLLKVSNNDIKLRDIAIKNSEEKWFETERD